MADESSIVRDLQLTIRRELDRRGRSLKAISFDADIPYSTLLSYFPGERDAVPHAMPVAALRKLTGHIPADLLSLLLTDGWLIVQAPEQLDHHEIADAMADYLTAKQHAHHPASEAGEQIGPGEHGELCRKLTVVASKAAAA